MVVYFLSVGDLHDCRDTCPCQHPCTWNEDGVVRTEMKNALWIITTFWYQLPDEVQAHMMGSLLYWVSTQKRDKPWLFREKNEPRE
jgi:hypothetical protein